MQKCSICDYNFWGDVVCFYWKQVKTETFKVHEMQQSY